MQLLNIDFISVLKCQITWKRIIDCDKQYGECRCTNGFGENCQMRHPKWKMSDESYASECALYNAMNKINSLPYYYHD